MVKRLLLLLPGAFTGYGGIEMYSRHLVKACLELSGEIGFEARILILNDLQEEIDGRYLTASAHRPIGCRREKPRFVWEAVRAAVVFRPDVVLFGHVHFAGLGLLLQCLPSRARHWYVTYGIEVWGPLRRLARREVLRADRVIAISDHTRKELATRSGRQVGRIDILPCALDPVWQGEIAGSRQPEREDGSRDAVLLTVARLAASERYKGVDAVIRALPAIARRVPGARYEVVGDGDDRERLESLAVEVGVADRVHFRGSLGPSALASAYEACMLYVMPSTREGFGIVFLEAALFGKPSVGGKHGGTPEVIEDGVTGVLVEQSNLTGLSDAIAGLLEDDVARERMGRAARERTLREFGFAAFKGRLLGFLSQTGRE